MILHSSHRRGPHGLLHSRRSPVVTPTNDGTFIILAIIVTAAVMLFLLLIVVVILKHRRRRLRRIRVSDPRMKPLELLGNRNSYPPTPLSPSKRGIDAMTCAGSDSIATLTVPEGLAKSPKDYHNNYNHYEAKQLLGDVKI